MERLLSLFNIIFSYQKYAAVSPKELFVMYFPWSWSGIRLNLIPDKCLNAQKSDVLSLCSCLCACSPPVRRPGSQQQQRCEGSRQQTEHARVQLRQSPISPSLPPFLPPNPSSHMRKKRWLSPAGSHSMSWRSSSSCCQPQVCKI